MTTAEALLDKDFIRNVNRVYHDVEFEFYDSNHPEIFSYEDEAWKILISKYIDQKFEADVGTTIVDIGTGTGFVVDQFLHKLTPNCRVYFVDISEKMLSVCAEKYKNYDFGRHFVKSDCQQIGIASNSADVVTINSVLHHIPDVVTLMVEVVRILKPGGIFVVKHEPNIRFSSNFILSCFYNALAFSRRVKSVLKRGVVKKSKLGTSDFFSTVEKKIINELEVEVVDLSPRGLSSIVDIQSPTAPGGLSKDRGFDPYSYLRDNDLTSKCSILSIETYGFYGKIVHVEGFFSSKISKLLKSVFPKDGYFFDLILRKNGNLE